jgi:hypothetical protein
MTRLPSWWALKRVIALTASLMIGVTRFAAA